jgi:hypothetical protein
MPCAEVYNNEGAEKLFESISDLCSKGRHVDLYLNDRLLLNICYDCSQRKTEFISRLRLKMKPYLNSPEFHVGEQFHLTPTSYIFKNNLIVRWCVEIGTLLKTHTID